MTIAHIPTNQLTIRGLNVRGVNVPMEPAVETAAGTVASAPLVLLDLETEEGIWGSSYIFTYSPFALRPMAELIRGMEAMIKGAPLAPRAIHDTLSKRCRLLGAQGLVQMGLSAIDMAVWDALAKAARMPLARLLGGGAGSVPAYVSLRAMSPEPMLAEAVSACQGGFGGVKARLGLATIAEDLKVVRRLRQEVGDGVDIMVDYNQTLTVPEAIRRARALAGEGLTWIEEPVLASDHLGHARVGRASGVPIQTGENWWGPADMGKSLAARASSFVMLDVMKIGGVTGWLSAMSLAEQAGLPVSSHIFIEASAQMLCVTPSAHWLEYLDIAGPILREPLAVKGGRVEVSQRPGLGLDWNEEVVERYRV